jgi:acyl dehydratase
MSDRYLDDLTVGESWDSEPFTITEAEIVAFATEFDPQPMHVDFHGARPREAPG